MGAACLIRPKIPLARLAPPRPKGVIDAIRLNLAVVRVGNRMAPAENLVESRAENRVGILIEKDARMEKVATVFIKAEKVTAAARGAGALAEMGIKEKNRVGLIRRARGLAQIERP